MEFRGFMRDMILTELEDAVGVDNVSMAWGKSLHTERTISGWREW